MKTERRSGRDPVIACAVDDQYLMPLAVMLKSMELNLRTDRIVTVHILHNEVRPSAREKVGASIAPDRVKLIWQKVSADKIADLKVSGHISRATYFRLLLEDSFPSINRLIYLDADTIVNADIAALWDIEIGDALLLAAPQISRYSGTVSGPRGVPNYKLLGLDPQTKCFNAGVLCINLNGWRKHKVSSQVVEYLRTMSDGVLWWDQDGLNVVLHDRWRALDYRWNLQTSLFDSYDTWRQSPLPRLDYYRAITEPYIIHFSAAPKPWSANYPFLYQDLFFRYLDATKWKGWRP